MTDRITNADVPRMLREMSPAAEQVAFAVGDALFGVQRACELPLNYIAYKLHKLYAVVGKCAEWMRPEEIKRAERLRIAVIRLARERYEIVDRWGK